MICNMRNCITYIEKNILVKAERRAIMSKTRTKISLRSTLKEIRPVNILMLFIAGIINSFAFIFYCYILCWVENRGFYHGGV